jgi:pyridoxamine 5'-phosphate oxidase
MTPQWKALLEEGADSDPFVQFGRWFRDAAAVVPSPEAMAVASADLQARPSVRMVLMKAWDEDGFVFHTHFESRKGHELTENPHASLLFYWEPLGRQVRIEGPVHRISDKESDAYFLTRPAGGRVGAYASHQSQIIDSREALDLQVQRIESQFVGHQVTRPPWWGGLRVQPQVFEFWQNREDRLHDRLRYTPDRAGWKVERLQP